MDCLNAYLNGFSQKTVLVQIPKHWNELIGSELEEDGNPAILKKSLYGAPDVGKKLKCGSIYFLHQARLPKLWKKTVCIPKNQRMVHYHLCHLCGWSILHWKFWEQEGKNRGWTYKVVPNKIAWSFGLCSWNSIQMGWAQLSHDPNKLYWEDCKEVWCKRKENTLHTNAEHKFTGGEG